MWAFPILWAILCMGSYYVSVICCVMGSIMAMDNDEIEHILPYIMCSHYICTFNEVTEQKIAIRGSHGKAYPGWFWPNLPSRDQEPHPAFLGCMRQQLLTDFKQHEER